MEIPNDFRITNRSEDLLSYDPYFKLDFVNEINHGVFFSYAKVAGIGQRRSRGSNLDNFDVKIGRRVI